MSNLKWHFLLYPCRIAIHFIDHQLWFQIAYFLKGVDLCVTFEKSIFFLLLISNLKHVKKTFLKWFVRNQLNFLAAGPKGSRGRLIKTMIHPVFKLWARFSENRLFQVDVQDCGKSIQSIRLKFCVINFYA